MCSTDNPLPDTPPTPDFGHLIETELSLRSRLGHIALLLGALMMTVVVSSLWLTEPTRPLRTQVAFASLIAIGLSWVAFALWVLTHRRPLYGRQSIVAGRMAVLFTGSFAAGALGLSIFKGGAASLAVVVAGFVMFATAIILTVRAHRAFARLSERRVTLEREIARRIK